MAANKKEACQDVLVTIPQWALERIEAVAKEQHRNRKNQLEAIITDYAGEL